jgi:DNA-binding HxlR family transcriptional regulator
MGTKPERGNVLDPNCPSRLLLDRLGDKWTGLIVLVLSDGTLRFGELRERVGNVAPKVLAQTLRTMERDGLVTRAVFAEVPPRTEYTLTELGESLLAPLNAVREWAETNVDRLLAARARADAVAAGTRS